MTPEESSPDLAMIEITMPRLDDSMQTAKLIEWLAKEGDRVEKGKPIVLVEGEKTTFEIEAPESGILHKTLYPSGSDVPVGKPIALMATATEPQQ